MESNKLVEKIDYFIARTDDRLDHIEKKIDKLLAFKFMIVGVSAAVSFLVSALINALK